LSENKRADKINKTIPNVVRKIDEVNRGKQNKNKPDIYSSNQIFFFLIR